MRLARVLVVAACVGPGGACAGYAFDSGFYDAVVRVDVDDGCTLDPPPQDAEGFATVKVAPYAREAEVDAPLPELLDVAFVSPAPLLTGELLEEHATSSSAIVTAVPGDTLCTADGEATRVLDLVDERDDGLRLVGRQDMRVDVTGDAAFGCRAQQCGADVELTLTLRGRCPAECIVGEPLACACPRETFTASVGTAAP